MPDEFGKRPLAAATNHLKIVRNLGGALGAVQQKRGYDGNQECSEEGTSLQRAAAGVVRVSAI